MLSANEVRLAIAALAALVVIAAAVNVPAAVLLTPARLTPRRTVLSVRGDEAAARGWPAPTAHTKARPEPTTWAIESAWMGHRCFRAWASDKHTSTHSMQVNESGWPLPVLRSVMRWWPWDHPVWRTTVAPDPGLQLAWAGVLLNPLMVGGGAWGVLVVLPLGVAALRRVARVRRALCMHCGYPAGASDVCTECGRSSACKRVPASPIIRTATP